MKRYRLPESKYKELSLEERVHYLAEARKGSVKRTFKEINGQAMPFYYAAVREVVVDPQLYQDRLDAKHRADAVLERLKAKSLELRSEKHEARS